tara:strand:+ start:618 stop:788 length:171 start_codon:yes stop_codon:yes gene_type:complete
MKAVERFAQECTDDIENCIEDKIYWAMYGTNYPNTDELKLKVKQQILFTLIKRVTK